MAAGSPGGMALDARLPVRTICAAWRAGWPPCVTPSQALTTHIEQLCALPDDLRQTTIDRCNRCGCHNERELAEHLQSLLRCPIARLLKACGQLGVQVRLPACLTLGKRVQELSWHGLLGHLRSRALAPGAPDQLRADFATVEASWPDICCRLRRRGMGSPHMLVINPRGPQGLWLLPSTLPQNPGWREPLRRTLCCAHPIPTAQNEPVVTFNKVCRFMSLSPSEVGKVYYYLGVQALPPSEIGTFSQFQLACLELHTEFEIAT